MYVYIHIHIIPTWIQTLQYTLQKASTRPFPAHIAPSGHLARVGRTRVQCGRTCIYKICLYRVIYGFTYIAHNNV